MNNDDRAKFEALTDEQIIAIKKSTKCSDPYKPWGDTLAFARAILASAQAASAEPVFVIKSPGEQAAAWRRIAELLHELKPDWCDAAPSGIEAAEKTIRYLAATAPVASAEPVAYHDKDQLGGVAWCPGYPDKLRDISPLYTTHAPAVAPVTDEQINALIRAQTFWGVAAKETGLSFGPELHSFARAVLALATRTPEPQAERPLLDTFLKSAEEAGVTHLHQLEPKLTEALLKTEPQPDSRGQAQEGWKLVRVEPIEAMEQFICTCDSRSGAGYTRDGEPVSPSWRTCYASLLAVASTPDEQRAQAAQEDVEPTVERLMGLHHEAADAYLFAATGTIEWVADNARRTKAADALESALRTALAGRQP